jgi:hypothetical protein
LFEGQAEQPTAYATNVVVQTLDHEFVLLFFRVEPPLLVGSDEDKRKALARVKGIKAPCVAKVVLAPGRMAELVGLLNSHWDRFVRNSEQGEPAKDQEKDDA